MIKMKKIIYLAFLLLLANASCAQQSEELYFISANPGFAYVDEMVFYDNILYSYSDSLSVVDTLSSKEKTETTFVKQYSNEKRIYISESFFYNDSSRITMLDYTSGINKSRVKTQHLAPYYNSNLISTSEGEMAFVISSEVENEKFKYLSIGNDMGIKEIQPDDFKNSVIAGSAGVAVEGSDFLLVYIDSEGKMTLPVTTDTTKRPILPISMPSNLGVKGRKAFFIKDRDISIIRTEYSPYSDKVGHSILQIFNHSDQKWVEKKIKGNLTNIRLFDSWIAGFVSSRLSSYKESPGRENRSTEISSLGFPFDFRARNSERYFPGILYLYHVPTEKYIEWSTGQGDSEILLVENNTVYYRVGDEIYKATIIENQKLDKPRIIIKNDKVRHIHWAFTTGKG